LLAERDALLSSRHILSSLKLQRLEDASGDLADTVAAGLLSGQSGKLLAYGTPELVAADLRTFQR
jgi:hypothetical protein